MERWNIYSFTETGSSLNFGLCRELSRRGYECAGAAVSRFASGFGLRSLDNGWKQQIGSIWGKRGLIFIGAAGIAVRSIAPWVSDKFTDSPVVVMDEAGQYVIPLLAGHVQGAVEMAYIIAEILGAVPVITTATDVRGRFAVDVFAKKNGLILTDRRLAKEISAAVLQGEKVGFYSEFPVEGEYPMEGEYSVEGEYPAEGAVMRTGELPKELALCRTVEELSEYDHKIAAVQSAASVKTERDRENCLLLLPRNLIIGIGCRRNVPEDLLEQELQKLLDKWGVRSGQIRKFASIDRKKDETGILALADRFQAPFVTFSPEELSEIESVSSRSSFVQETVGVDNVCERAALYASKSRILYREKCCMEKCTFAAAAEPVVLKFAKMISEKGG